MFKTFESCNREEIKDLIYLQLKGLHKDDLTTVEANLLKWINCYKFNKYDKVE